MKGTLAVTGDPESDQLLNTDPLALLIGMLLDQQVPMEWAFAGPKRLVDRLGGALDAAAIAAMAPEEVEAVFKEKPAMHRFPGSMGRRTHELCRAVADRYDGRAERIWEDVATGDELVARLNDLPGYGTEKAKIFAALLAKRFGVTPKGWEEATAPFSDQQPRSVADITSPETLEQVRSWKKAMKAKGKAKTD
jgi:uncharacterized HhH-GPD family protein